jgi:hypothetical protein
MSIAEKLKNSTVPSLYTAAIGTGLYYTMIDNDLSSQLPFFGATIPTWVGVSLSTGLGSTVGHVLNEFVISKIPALKDDGLLEKDIAPALISGLATYGVMTTAISKDTSLAQGVLLGSVSSLAGNALYKRMY